MSIVKTSFGKLPCGCEADLYILKNASGASVEITNFGGIIHAINVPDRDGKLGDVVLGYKDVNGYLPCNGYHRRAHRPGGQPHCGRSVHPERQRFLSAGQKRRRRKPSARRRRTASTEKLWEATPIEGIGEDMPDPQIPPLPTARRVIPAI